MDDLLSLIQHKRVTKMFTLPALAARNANVRQNLKILLVDDHEATRKALQLVLRTLDCTAEVAENGFEALGLLRHRQYDLVFMDLMMPVMDGLAATRQIRQERPPGAGPRIIGISADSAVESRELCFSVGMDGFLPKPLVLQELIRVIEEATLERVGEVRRLDLATWILDATPTDMSAEHASIKNVVVHQF
jgi:CheY-like chemotaxis protein